MENDNPIVIIDEMYRAGKGAKLKRNHYGTWRENINIDVVDMLSFIESTYTHKHAFDDYSATLLQTKTVGQRESNLIVTNEEKWERRKDLTGIILKITTNAVYYCP